MPEPEELIELYQFESCPYCSKVRKKLTQMQIDFIARQVEPNGRREEVKELTGETQVPALKDPNTGKVMNESDDIIEYLEEQYG
ncbi:MAG: glutathione S-transferase N-terminal domain-containing protein [Candidatus Nanohaloarchaea archaeon]